MPTYNDNKTTKEPQQQDFRHPTIKRIEAMAQDQALIDNSLNIALGFLGLSPIKQGVKKATKYKHLDYTNKSVGGEIMKATRPGYIPYKQNPLKPHYGKYEMYTDPNKAVGSGISIAAQKSTERSKNALGFTKKKDTYEVNYLSQTDDKGAGAEMLNKVIDMAKKDKADVKLTASSNLGTPIDTLVKYYEKFGFEKWGSPIDYTKTRGYIEQPMRLKYNKLKPIKTK